MSLLKAATGVNHTLLESKMIFDLASVTARMNLKGQ